MFDLSKEFNILFVEDVESDVQLAIRYLHSEGIKFKSTIVQTEEDFRAALTNFNPDLIISDYSMPQFSGMEAIIISKEVAPSIPIIIFTGSIDEDTAVKCMKAGASDYVLKEKLLRLPFAVKECLEHSLQIKKRLLAEQALDESENKFKKLVDSSPSIIYVIENNQFVFSNPIGLQILGLSTIPEINSLKISEIVDKNDIDLLNNILGCVFTHNLTEPLILRLKYKNHSTVWLETIAVATIYEGREAVLLMGIDITKRKITEVKLEKSEHELEVQNEINQIFLTISDTNIYSNILEVLLREFECKYGLFGYINQKEELVVPSLTSNIWDLCAIPNKNFVFPKNEWKGLWGKCLIENRSMFSNESLNVPHGHIQIKNALCVPLIYQENTIGIFTLADKTEGFTIDDQKRLDLIASYVSPILSARLERDLKEENIQLTKEILYYTEERLRLALQASNDGLWDLMYNLKSMYWSPRTFTMLGYEVDEFIVNVDSYQSLIHENDREKSWASLLEQIANPDRSFTLKFRMRKKNGKYIWILSRGKVVQEDENGNPIRVVGTHVDLTEIKESQEELKFQSQILGEIKDLVTAVDLDGNVIYVNQAVVNDFEVSKEELMSVKLFTFKEHPSTSVTRAHIFDQTIKNGSWEGEVTTYSRSNKKLIFYTRTWLIYNEDKKPHAVVSISSDISAQKAALESLKVSEENYRLLAETAQDLILTHDFDGNITYINKTGMELIGHYEDYSTVNIFDKVPLQSKHLIENNREERLKGDYSKRIYQLDLIDKDGNLIPYEVSSSPILVNNQLKGLLIIARDITERIKSAKIIKENEVKFNKAFHENSGAMLITTTDGYFLEVNQAFCKLTEYSKDEILSNNILTEHIFNNKNIFKFLKTTINSITQVEDIEIQIKTNSGQLKHALFSANKVTFNDELRWLIVLQDVTKRKEAETKLRESEKLFRSIWENSKDGMRLTDNNGKITMVNNAFCLLVERPKYELEGNLISVMYKEHTAAIVLKAYINNFNKHNISPFFESKFQLWNEKTIWLAVSNSFLSLDFNNHLVLSIFRDISERKENEEKLLEAKYEAERSNNLKDTFIANISHEIRTPLNGISGMVSLLKDSIHNFMSKEQEEIFSSINRSNIRIVRTIDMIVNYSRLKVGEYPYNPIRFNICKLIKDLSLEFKPLAESKNLNFILECCQTDIVVNADEYSIKNAISYILDNAIKFTSDGFIKISLTKNDNNATFTVEDTGCGISEEYMSRLFEPYSQEEEGYNRSFEGTGLGLSLTKKFLELNNYPLHITSSKNVGTKVSIFLSNIK